MKTLFTLAALGCVTLATADQYRPYSQQNYRQYGYEQQTDQGTRTYQTNTSRTNQDQVINKKVQDLLAPGFFSKGYPTVTFEVLEGVVTLRGSIDTQSNKQQLEDSVRNIDGVTRVNNQLIVGRNGQTNQTYQQPSDRTYNDQRQSNSAYSEQQNGRAYNDQRSGIDSRSGSYNAYDNTDSRAGSYNAYDQKDNARFYQKNGAAATDQTIRKQIQDLLAPGYFSKGYPTVIFELQDGVVTLKGTIDTQENKSSLEESISGIDGVKRIDNQIKVVKEVRRSY